jgi:hypothetical protein
VHLLHVDTRGHDYEVLKTLDLVNHAPVAIFIEHKHLPDSQKTEMLYFFRKHAYSVRECGGDYFAVNNKAHERLERGGFGMLLRHLPRSRAMLSPAQSCSRSEFQRR